MPDDLLPELTHDEIVLARIGEITLKGLNRGKFEHKLLENIKRRLKILGHYTISQTQSRFWIETSDQPADLPAVMRTVSDVFGIVSVSPVWRFSGGMPELLRQAVAYAATQLSPGQVRSFKIESRRGNKKFPQTSPEISSQVGETILEAFPGRLRVDVHRPDFTIYVEVRDFIYLYSQIIQGHKGLPVGTGGRGMLLLSGGIDSPVAGYMMASRGMELEAVYFHAFPFTSDQAKEKVLDLGRILTTYTGRLTVHVVDFTDIQLTLRDHCPHDMMTLVMRRMMMRIAERLALSRDCKALITGESLGQVASQTLEALTVTGQVVTLPVFQPLIGINKDDTITLARRIGTFETSILPFEDCCTVFVAKHPKTHPKLDDVIKAEQDLDIESLVNQGLLHIEEVNL
ncbi:MAG: tRNA uracil 4-sulfurtransferase ThiI [Clostridiaceae bacterium]|nr:tRNA uracil 4-sulfurtransferase ThiI [Clostridiaceae bacterium]